MAAGVTNCSYTPGEAGAVELGTRGERSSARRLLERTPARGPCARDPCAGRAAWGVSAVATLAALAFMGLFLWSYTSGSPPDGSTTSRTKGHGPSPPSSPTASRTAATSTGQESHASKYDPTSSQAMTSLMTTTDSAPSDDSLTFYLGHAVCPAFGSFRIISYHNSTDTAMIGSACLNAQLNALTCPRSELFLMTFSAVLKKPMVPPEYFTVLMVGAQWNMTLARRRVDALDGEDTAGSSVIVGVREELPVTTRANYYIDEPRDDNQLTSWGGFRLAAVTSSPSDAFAVEENGTLSVLGDITFRRVNHPTGSATFTRYTAPEYGVYYFSFVLHEEGPATVHLKVDGAVRAEASRGGAEASRGGAGVSAGTMSRVVMLMLRAGQVVTLHLAAGTATNPAFYGFRYRPPGDAVVAWSAHRSTPMAGSQGEVLTFDVTLTNVGDALNATSSVVTIPVTGAYYLHMNAGVVAGVPCTVYMRAGDRTHALRRTSSRHARDTIGRAVISQLGQGDLVYVTLKSGGADAVYSDERLQTSFTGFLIQPTEHMHQ